MSRSPCVPAPAPALLRALLLAVLLLPTSPLLLTGCGRAGAAPVFHGTAYEPPEPAPEFTLVDHTGRAASLSDYRGKGVLLFFGFVNCPDVCPLTLSRLRQAAGSIGRMGEDVQLLLVTVDPERDTPAALAEYVQRFGPGITGLTGEAAELERIRAAYGAYAEHRDGAGGHPQVMHSTVVFGIDRAGQLRVLLHADRPEEEIRSDLRTLLSL